MVGIICATFHRLSPKLLSTWLYIEIAKSILTFVPNIRSIFLNCLHSRNCKKSTDFLPILFANVRPGKAARYYNVVAPMHIVLSLRIYHQMATALVLPPVDKHALACKMVNLSATPTVTNVLYKIDSESIIK